MTFTFKRSQQDDLTFDLFAAVLVDGKEIPAGSYNARAGSVVIELLPAYLETLDVERIRCSRRSRTASAKR